jgi:rhodanese-related sulfurtransferase
MWGMPHIYMNKNFFNNKQLITYNKRRNKMNLRKLYYLMLIIPMLFVYTGCSDDDTTTPPVTVNETQVLVDYLEANGDPVSGFPKMVKASDVNANVLAGGTWAIIDIRDADTYAAGHIQGAVNVSQKEVLDYYETNNLETKEKVVVVCFSGQSAAWVNGLLWTAGKTNTFDMKWGMCSWSATTSGSWTGANVNNSRATEFVTTATAKPAAGDLPTLTTGETTGSAILRARVETIFAEGFGGAATSSDAIYGDLSANFILNYWGEADYSWGHIAGAMQYTPKAALSVEADLKTLPTDKTVAVYCYTGQTSAHVSSYLRVLGYDAKSITFGVNGMSHDDMPENKFNPDTEIHDYTLVQ